MLQTEQATVR